LIQTIEVKVENSSAAV